MTLNLQKNAFSLSVCAGLLSILSASSAFGNVVVVASDNFNSYAPASGLNGKNGGTGWAGAWAVAGTTNATVVSTILADVPMSDKAVRLTGFGDAAATRTLAASVSGNVIVNFDFQFDAGSISNNDFLGLWFGSSAGPNIGLKANCGDSKNCADGADLFVRNTASTGSYFQNIDVGTTYNIMGHLQKIGSSKTYNRFDLWVNPDASEIANLSGADVFTAVNSNLTSFDQIGFRMVNLVNKSTSDAILIDNLSLSRVPEPGVLTLLGLGLVGLAFTRRRKSS